MYIPAPSCKILMCYEQINFMSEMNANITNMGCYMYSCSIYVL